MALQTLQLTAGNRLPPCSLSNIQVLLTQEKQREGRAFGDIKLLNEPCKLSLCKGKGLLPHGLVSPTLASRNVSEVEQYLLALGLIRTWKLQSNRPFAQNFVNKSNICIFTRGTSLLP